MGLYGRKIRLCMLLSLLSVAVFSRAAEYPLRDSSSSNSEESLVIHEAISRNRRQIAVAGHGIDGSRSSLDQRLTALFGSDSQPVYGDRDPTTGRISLDKNASFRTTGSDNGPPQRTGHADSVPNHSLVVSVDPSQDSVDRKDTRLPENNEINPFQLFPPEFHGLLNIPIHDYGNGTSYNPYDKYKVPKVKYPVVSSGYANTNYQGSSGSTTVHPPSSPIHHETYDGYDSESDYGQKVTKPTRRPTYKPKTTSTTANYNLDDSLSSTASKKYRPRPSTTETPKSDDYTYTTTTKSVNTTPGTVHGLTGNDDNQPPVYRPQYPKENQYQYPKENQYPKYQPTTYQKETPQPPNYDIPYRNQPPSATRVPDSYDEPPVYIPQNYEIKVTPKPFYAVQDSGYVQQTAGQVDDIPDIIYDYDDERNKGEGVLFVVDKGQTSVQRPNVPANNVTPRPAVTISSAGPDNTYSINVQSTDNRRPFRPSAPLDTAPLVDVFTPKPNTAPLNQYNDQYLPNNQFQYQTPHLKQSPGANAAIGLPRPPFESSSNVRFPDPQPAQLPVREQSLPQAGNVEQPPNILPLFRPNAKPSDDLQFIKRPQDEFPNQQPYDYQQNVRQPPQEFQGHLRQPQPEFQPNVRQPLPHGRPPLRPLPNGQDPQRSRPLPAGIKPFREPLPSALSSPFSQISQAVANFFGRRSSNQNPHKRSSDVDLATSVKSDRTGIVDEAEKSKASDDLVAEENRPYVFFTKPIHQPVSVERSDSALVSEQRPTTSHLLGIQSPSDPSLEGQKPPAFYVYTSKGLEKGEPPYLVVGPQYGPPPNVEGARLVHTVPAQPYAPESQRRNDFPQDGVRPPSLNSLPLTGQQFASVNQQVNHPIRQALPTIAPSRPSFLETVAQQVRPALRFPSKKTENKRPPPFSLPPENSPLGARPPTTVNFPGVPQSPPRVPLNPSKDVATPYGDHVLLHDPAGTGPGNQQAAAQLQNYNPFFINNQAPPSYIRPAADSVIAHSQPFASVPTNNLQPLQGSELKPHRPSSENSGLKLNSALPVVKVNSKPFTVPESVESQQGPVPATTQKPIRTTPAFPQAFHVQEPVKYSTIQQEDGKQIAVVHPAYVVTYRGKPGPPELVNLDAPFIPSVESPTEEGEMSSIPFQQWHALPVDNPVKDSNTQSSENVKTVQTSPNVESKPQYESGFLPFVPGKA